MEFDFYQQFASYSTADLLKIIRQTEQYQPEAVAAAGQILGERDISPDDVEQADRYFQDTAAEKRATSEHLQFYKGKVAEIIEPIIVPGKPLAPSRWFRLFLLAFGILYAWSFYGFIKKQLHFLRCEDCRGDITLWGSFINIVYLSVVLFLLIKKRRWAWILLVAGNITAIPSGIFQVYLLYKYRQLLHVDISTAVFIIVYPIALLIFLWKTPMADFFGVDDTTKRRTVWGGVVLSLLYGGIIHWL